MLSAMRLGFGGHIEGGEPIDPEPKSEGAQSRSGPHAAAE
jgi:6-phosphogluconate dehydrogenase